MTFLALIATAALTSIAGAPPTLSPSPQHVKELRAFFKHIDKRYPFFDVKGIRKDWRRTKAELLRRAKKCRSDAEFAEIVVDAARCLRDGHFSFPKMKVELPAHEEFYSGFAFLPATDGRVVVMHPRRDLATVMPTGTVVTEIDGRDARAVLEARGEEAWQAGGFFSSPQRARLFEYRIALRGERGSKHELRFLDGKRERKRSIRVDQPVKGWAHHYNLPADLQEGAKSVWHTQLESGAGYIYMRRMDATAQRGFEKALAAHPEASGWIVDLRGNSGGGYDSAFKTVLSKIDAPVVGIIDAGAVSAAETFARDLVEHAGAQLIGSTSAGSSSRKEEWTFPSGLLTVRFSVSSRSGLNGKPIEFSGITPHVRTEAVPEEVAAGKNSALLRAEELLTGGKGEQRGRRRRRR